MNPFFDKNGDGVLDVGTEILPNLGTWVDQDTFIDILREVPNVYEQATNLRQPVLVLQGELDGATRLRNTRGLNHAFAGYPDFTLKEYPGLDHSFSPVRGISYDRLTFYSEQSKADIAAWLLDRAARIAPAPLAAAPTPAILPNTGEAGPNLGWMAGAALALLLLGCAVHRRAVH